MTKSDIQNEDALEKILREQEQEKNERLDKIVLMQHDLFFKKIKYNTLFAIASILATILMVSIGMPLWIGVLFFLGLFSGLRYMYFNKLVLHRYNEHVKGLYKEK